MVRTFIVATFALAVAAPSFADFSCPGEATPVERKDEAQWMKACRDAKGRLHGPFEVWTRLPADLEADPAYRKTTEGKYAQGVRVGKWTYWNIEGAKVAEQEYP